MLLSATSCREQTGLWITCVYVFRNVCADRLNVWRYSIFRSLDYRENSPVPAVSASPLETVYPALKKPGQTLNCPPHLHRMASLFLGTSSLAVKPRKRTRTDPVYLESSYEKNFSTQRTQAQAYPRISLADGHQGRQTGFEPPPRQRSQTSLCVELWIGRPRD